MGLLIPHHAQLTHRGAGSGFAYFLWHLQSHRPAPRRHHCRKQQLQNKSTNKYNKSQRMSNLGRSNFLASTWSTTAIGLHFGLSWTLARLLMAWMFRKVFLVLKSFHRKHESVAIPMPVPTVVCSRIRGKPQLKHAQQKATLAMSLGRTLR